MQNKMKNIKSILLSFVVLSVMAVPAYSADEIDDQWMEEISANAIAEYELEGSLFQKITDLEQEKVLMQLEKERAQLDLELDRLAAEKIKLHMEIDTLAGRAEEQQQALEAERLRIEAETEKLEKQMQSAANQTETTVAKKQTTIQSETSEKAGINEKYRLVEIIGAGNQLQATLEDVENGQRKKASVGKFMDGYEIKSISLDDGVVFLKGGNMETLNISRDN